MNDERKTDAADPADPPVLEDRAGEPDDTDAVDEAAAPRSRGGRAGVVLALLALVLALGAGGGAGWLYWELVHKAPREALEERLVQQGASRAERLAEIEQRLGQLAAEQARTLETFAAEQERRFDATRRELVNSLNAVANQAPPSEQTWRLAEAEYLLRIANHRVLMERDIRSALTLLQGVDAMLAELDDLSLHNVRAELAQEILQLKAVPADDTQGVYLQLEALKGLIPALPISVPEFLATDLEPEPIAPDAWSELKAGLKSLVSIRRVEGATAAPLLAPSEEHYLELNLRLMLERAQLALLRRDKVVYEQSLANVGEWIATYLDRDAPAVTQFAATLEELSLVDFDQPLPDVSGSLAELTRMRRGVAE